MKYGLEIEMVNNGFIITPDDSCEGEVNVIEFDEHSRKDSEINRVKIQELLYTIIDFFNERGSKHDRYRTVIEVIKNS